MADLDDFFAKKDKKKARGRRFTTTEDIAKKLEESGKKAEKMRREKSNIQPQTPGQEGEEAVITTNEDDEWKDFEEEKKDYTGLRIGNLQINDSESDGIDQEAEEEHLEENEAGEMVLRKKVQSGPWKMVTVSQAAVEIKEEPEVEIRQESSVPGQKYILPQLRNSLKDSTTRDKKTKTAPDINNEESFPTLSAAKTMDPNTGAWGKKKRDEGSFEEVRNSKSHSSRYADISAGASGPKLSLGNKFGALSTDQS